MHMCLHFDYYVSSHFHFLYANMIFAIAKDDQRYFINYYSIGAVELVILTIEELFRFQNKKSDRILRLN